MPYYFRGLPTAMRENEFQDWLRWRGATSDGAIKTRTFAVRKIEENLASLGSSNTSLEEELKGMASPAFESGSRKFVKMRSLAGRITAFLCRTRKTRITDWFNGAAG